MQSFQLSIPKENVQVATPVTNIEGTIAKPIVIEETSRPTASTTVHNPIVVDQPTPNVSTEPIPTTSGVGAVGAVGGVEGDGEEGNSSKSSSKSSSWKIAFKSDLSDEETAEEIVRAQSLVRYHNSRFVCSILGCDKTYANRHDIKAHVKEHYTTKKKIECSVCGKTFGRMLTKKEHEAAKHTFEILYRCVCGEGFFYGAKFSIHKNQCGQACAKAKK